MMTQVEEKKMPFISFDHNSLNMGSNFHQNRHDSFRKNAS